MKVIKFADNKKTALVENAEGQQAWLKVTKKDGKTAVDLASFDKELAKQQAKAARPAEPESLFRFTPRVESENAVMADFEVTLVRLDGESKTYSRSCWLPKSQLVGNQAPAWLVKAKVDEFLDSLPQRMLVLEVKFL